MSCSDISKEKRWYLLRLSDKIINAMIEEYKLMCISIFGNIIEWDKILKRKLFWDLFKMANI